MPDKSRHLILYDGSCGLCARFKRFVIRWDVRRRFKFEPLQGARAKKLLARYGRNAEDLDTLYAVAHPTTPDEFILWKSAAVYFVLVNVFWFGMDGRPRFFPNRFCDWTYDWIAARRYRFFGRSEKCLMPNDRGRR